MSFYQ